MESDRNYEFAKERRVNWTPAKKFLPRRNPLTFHQLHRDLRREEIRRQEQADETVFTVNRHINLDGIKKIIAKEGITLEQHHHFDPFSPK